MGNYPNMSYCAVSNTLLALQQVLSGMREEGPMFLQNMTREEKNAYRELFTACEEFIWISQEFEEELGGENDGQPDEAQEWHDFDPDC